MKTTTFGNGLIWFGAGISIAEIITGMYVAPLGFAKGMLAIVIGHIIGAVLMYAAGIIGANTKKCAMDTVKMSFGVRGGNFFAILNVLQLVGWTGIMIYDGSIAANKIFNIGTQAYALLIGVLILVWIMIGITNLSKVNVLAMSALFVLSLVLFYSIFFKNGIKVSAISEEITFGSALELCIAMPLSWLPLISDYTCCADKPKKSTLVSVVVYNLVSVFMYIIGMGAYIFTGEYDLSIIMQKANIGVIGLFIIVFSTVTTTFLDAYSAGISSVSIFSKLNYKYVAAFVTLIGTCMACVFCMDDITEFLYLIGSVFAPMIAIMIADFFLLKKESLENVSYDMANLMIWLVGFLIYRLLMRYDFVIGNTLIDMLLTIAMCVVKEKICCLRRRVADSKI